MKNLSIALMAAFMLVLAAMSTGQAQSAAEGIYNDPSPGGKYVYRGCNLAQVIFIRGDKLSEINQVSILIIIYFQIPLCLKRLIYLFKFEYLNNNLLS